MTDAQIFERLFNGGNYSLPYLIKFEHSDAGTIRLVNNNEDVTFNNEVYKASTFDYTPPSSDGTGGSLKISSLPGENELFEFVENADDNYSLLVVGLLVENTPQAIRVYKHFHGVANVDEKGNIEFSLDSDDRLEMTFPPYVFDTDNNRGNA